MKQAKKISENVVKLETIYYTKKGKPVTISQHSFAKNFIDERLQSFQNNIDLWNNMDMEVYRAKQLEEPLREVARYAKLKQAMDGQIDDTVIVEEDK